MSDDVRVTAAALFTSRYSRAGYNQISARAAGADCGILLVRIAGTIDDGAVEAIHYSSTVYSGGVDHFYRERTFRGVVYRDSSGQIWRYGVVGEGEAKTVTPC